MTDAKASPASSFMGLKNPRASTYIVDDRSRKHLIGSRRIAFASIFLLFQEVSCLSLEPATVCLIIQVPGYGVRPPLSNTTGYMGDTETVTFDVSQLLQTICISEGFFGV